MADRAADVIQSSTAILAGAVAPGLLGPEALGWVLAALAVCSLADATSTVQPNAWRLAVRYLSSVMVTLAASYAVGAWVTAEVPGWSGRVWPVRVGAAVAAGIVLHPLIAAAPSAMGELWGVVLAWLRKRAGVEQ